MRKEPQGVFSDEMSRHIYFMEYNLLHAVYFYVVICAVLCCCKSSLYIHLSSIVHTANREIRQCVKWLLTERLKTMEKIKLSAPKSGRGCLQKVFIYKRLLNWALVGKVLVF